MKNNRQLIIKIIKVTLISSSLLIGLIILLLVIIPLLINPNKHRTFISNKFTQATGRKLELDAGISFKLFPSIAIHLNKAAIPNSNQFAAGNLAEIKSLDLSMSLLPLLTGNIKITNLTINGLNVNLIKGKDSNNWSFNTGSTHGLSSHLNLVINSLALNNTRISYTDLATNTITTTKSFNLLIKATNKIDLSKKKIAIKNANFYLNKILWGKVNLMVDNPSLPHYYGNLTLTDFSLNEVLDKLNIKLPTWLKKAPFSRVSLATTIQGKENSIFFNDLILIIANSTLKGNINGDFTPFSLTESLALNEVNVNDFIDLNGFKLKLKSVSLNGTLQAGSKDKWAANGKETINIKQITLYGLDINQFSAEINKAIKNISSLNKLTTNMQAQQSIKYIRQSIEKIKGQRQKNYHDTSNLGSFTAILLINNGIITTPTFNLNGKNLKSWGRGLANFKQKSVNYTLISQITSPEEPTFINYIYFPYTLQGQFSQIKGGFNWVSILRQLTNYYATSKKDKPLLNKAYDKIKDFFIIKH